MMCQDFPHQCLLLVSATSVCSSQRLRSVFGSSEPCPYPQKDWMLHDCLSMLIL